MLRLITDKEYPIQVEENEVDKICKTQGEIRNEYKIQFEAAKEEKTFDTQLYPILTWILRKCSVRLWILFI